MLAREEEEERRKAAEAIAREASFHATSLLDSGKLSKKSRKSTKRGAKGIMGSSSSSFSSTNSVKLTLPSIFGRNDSCDSAGSPFSKSNSSVVSLPGDAPAPFAPKPLYAPKKTGNKVSGISISIGLIAINFTLEFVKGLQLRVAPGVDQTFVGLGAVTDGPFFGEFAL